MVPTEFAFAERFLQNGNEVLVCIHSLDKLDAAKKKHPQLHTYPCDVGVESERVSLFQQITEAFPTLNILINNAGIQQGLNLKESLWDAARQEMPINLEAPIHFRSMFLPQLMKQDGALTANVTSGLGCKPRVCIPIPIPMYCTLKWKHKSWDTNLCYWNNDILPYFGQRPTSHATPADVEKFIILMQKQR